MYGYRPWMPCMAQVTMSADLETEDLVEQYKYRCCVCDRVTTTAKIRTCRNPTCLQTLCSTWCSILHNKRICPTHREIKARADTICRYIGYEQGRRGRSSAGRRRQDASHSGGQCSQDSRDWDWYFQSFPEHSDRWHSSWCHRSQCPEQGRQEGGGGCQPRTGHRSRSGFRNQALHASLAPYTHGTATYTSADVHRGRP